MPGFSVQQFPGHWKAISWSQAFYPASGSRSECRSTIIDLADSTQPLPCSAYRHFPLLGKSTLVDQKSGLLLIANKIIAIPGDLIDNSPRIPFAVNDKLLKIDSRMVIDKLDAENPERARQSMSGFGINVTKLYQAAGWPFKNVTYQNSSEVIKMSSLCGLVLIR
jgi:hypothetical protein